MTPVVDLLVPTFNNEKTVIETLNSLLNQSYQNCRITVFDNVSSDQTVAVIHQHFGDQIEVVVNERNLGGEGNFNRCIEAARGDFFAICHSDDIYLPDFVKSHLEGLLANPNANLSFTHAQRIDADGRELGFRFLPSELDDHALVLLSLQDFYRLSFKYGNVFTCPTAFFRTSVVQVNQLRFVGERHKSSGDLGLWWQLARLGDILFLTDPLIQYRESDVSFSVNLKKARTHRHDLFLVLDDIISTDPGGLEKALPDWREYFEFLKFKDNMMRTLNVFKTKNWSEMPAHDFDLKMAASVFLSSDWHTTFALKALPIYFVKRCQTLLT